MSIKVLKEKKLTWVNIDQINQEAIDYLKEHYSFHHLDFEDLQSEQQTPKIDTYKSYLFLVLQFPQWQASTKTINAHEIDIFVGDDYLITIQHTKSKDIKNFFYRCMNNRKIKSEWMSQSAGYLLYHLVDALFQKSRPMLNRLGSQISKVEQGVFDDSGRQADVVKNLAIIRRNVLSLRRIIEPQKYITGTLSHTRKPFLPDELAIYFDNVTDYLNKVWAITDTYKDTINGLHVTLESLINQRTNKVIGSLTVISVALLPLTLLSGIYGMNIDHLPFAHSPIWVWGVFGMVAFLILATIAVMKKKHWI